MPVPFYLTFSHPLLSATHQNVWIPYCLPTTQLCPLCSINMHLSSQKSLNAAPNLILGSLLLSTFLDPLFVALKTFGNAPTLLYTGSSTPLAVTDTTNKFFHLKQHYSNLVSSSSDNPRSLANLRLHSTRWSSTTDPTDTKWIFLALTLTASR